MDSVLVLLDLSSAFDTIDHDTLILSVEHLIGINRTTLKWFKSYLSDQSQFVLLGPILFT